MARRPDHPALHGQNQPQQQIPARTVYPESIMTGVSMEWGAMASATVISGGRMTIAAISWRVVAKSPRKAMIAISVVRNTQALPA
ncbi:MAG: hypothetical protein IJS14_05510 [Lentisphaeria bacterium]|nr:hypothetical protein [Lentisphaeria bacterium]